MQKLTERNGYDSTDRALRFHAIRLKSRPQTKALAEGHNENRRKLRQAHDQYLDAREERVATTAEIGYLDWELGEKVMTVSRDVLYSVNNDREAPLYRRLFPEAPSEAMRPIASESQELFVESLLQRLESNNDCEPFRHHIPSLQESLQALQATQEERKKQYIKEAQAEAEWRICRDEVQRAYNLSYHRLQLLFPEKERLVESFFLRRSTSNDQASSPGENDNS